MIKNLNKIYKSMQNKKKNQKNKVIYQKIVLKMNKNPY